MILFILWFFLSVARGGTPEEERTLAIIVAIPGYEPQTTLEPYRPIPPTIATRAEELKYAFTERGADVVVLSDTEKTTPSAIEKTFTTLAEKPTYDHVILMWFGWQKEGELQPREGDRGISLGKVQRWLEEIAEQQTVILDVGTVTSSGWLNAFSAENWPTGQRTTVISTDPNTVPNPYSLPELLFSIMRQHADAIDYQTFVDRLVKLGREEHGATFSLSIRYGLGESPRNIFVGEPRMREITGKDIPFPILVPQ